MIALTVVYAHLNATRQVIEAIEAGTPVTEACRSAAFLEPFYGLFEPVDVVPGSHLWSDDPTSTLRHIEDCLRRGLDDLTHVGVDRAVDEVMNRLGVELAEQFISLAPHISPALAWYHHTRPHLMKQFDTIPSEQFKELADLLNHVDRSMSLRQFVEVLDTVTVELREQGIDEIRRRTEELGSPLTVLQEHLSRVLLRRQIETLDLTDDHARELFVEHGYLPAEPSGDEA